MSITPHRISTALIKYLLSFFVVAALTACQSESDDTRTFSDGLDNDRVTVAEDLEASSEQLEQPDQREPVVPEAVIEARSDETSNTADSTINAALVNTTNDVIGVVTVTPNDSSSVLIEINASNLPPSGTHAVHLHEKGNCDMPDFKTAGGHYNPADMPHDNPDDSTRHAGDMPNQVVDDEGNLNAQIINNKVAFDVNEDAQEAPFTLYDDDGTALIIHAGADDYTSQPSGAAGSRIACAVLTRPKAASLQSSGL